MVIYFGAGAPMADWRFYACDFDSGEIVFLDPADFGGFPPGGPAGGDLTGTYPNPSIDTVPDAALSVNVPVMTAGVLPGASAVNLTDVPAPDALQSGSGALDGSGVLFFVLPVAVNSLVACWGTEITPAGQLMVDITSGTDVTITSSAGGTDAGGVVRWIGF